MRTIAEAYVPYNDTTKDCGLVLSKGQRDCIKRFIASRAMNETWRDLRKAGWRIIPAEVIASGEVIEEAYDG